MIRSKQFIIGVTGITGSGTSTVSAILEEEGGFVISADKLTRELMQPGHAVYDKIIRRFGDTILNEDGQINRKTLGSIVFGNPIALKELEDIIHPEVIAETKKQLSSETVIAGLTRNLSLEIPNQVRDDEGLSFAVIDAPLLIESGMHKMCDTVWLITAANEIRISRITTRDSIPPQTAQNRINSRKGDDYLRPFAQVEIENNGTTEELVRRVKKELQSI